MMKHVSVLLGITSLLLSGAIACSGSNFEGKTEQSDTPQGADSTGVIGEVPTPTPGDVTGGKVVIEPVNEKEEKAIANCAKAWGGQVPPYSKDGVRKISALVSVASRGVVLSDQQKTEQPQLTILYSAVTVAGTPEWELLNPNGWYCIVSAVNVGTILTVNIDKDAHLADSAVGVNVASDVDSSISAIGVNVGSKIKVVKK